MLLGCHGVHFPHVSGTGGVIYQGHKNTKKKAAHRNA